MTKISNRWQEIAHTNITNAYNWILGEYENAVDDGDMTVEALYDWVKEHGVDYVYHEAILTAYYEDMAGGPAPVEMRFATKDWCLNLIKDLFRKDGYDIGA